ncbi:hypothetical protein Pcinc_016810 [Petrolisthes cinctipes]|uniref:Uncharacterized protein n=1 Tax=Petrolisthes cinctipes TaxID=88211 RepID=A0AAE1FQK5_PETCI|nr:hypothetical protein Pcinc_016810 [Petrolisthes cinctipes]
MADMGERKENKKGKNNRKEPEKKNMKGKNEVSIKNVPATGRLVGVVYDNRRGGGMQEGRTSLHIAAAVGSLREVEILLSQGVDIHCRSNLTTDQGRHPLHMAVREDHLRVASVLLEAGADPNATDYHRLKPLHIAAQFSHVKMVGLLVTFGARLESRDDQGSPGQPSACQPITPSLPTHYPQPANPLPPACQPITLSLPTHYPQPANPLPSACQPITLSLPTHYPQPANPLTPACQPITLSLPTHYPQPANPLTPACQPITLSLPTHYPQPANPLPPACQPITLSLPTPNYNLHQARVRSVGGGSWVETLACLRALHIAAASGRLDNVRALYHYGCNLISEDSRRATALHHAAQAGNLEMVRWLVEKRVPHNLQDVNGERPSDWAEESGHYDIQRPDNSALASPPVTPTQTSSPQVTSSSSSDNIAPLSSSSMESLKTLSQSTAFQTPTTASQHRSQPGSPTGSSSPPLTLSPSMTVLHSPDTPPSPVPVDTVPSSPVASTTLTVNNTTSRLPALHSTVSSAYSSASHSGSSFFPSPPSSPLPPQPDNKKHKTKKAGLISVIKELTLKYMEQNVRINELEEMEDQLRDKKKELTLRNREQNARIKELEEVEAKLNKMKRSWEGWVLTPEGRAAGTGDDPFRDIPYMTPPMISGVLHLTVEPSTNPDPEGPNIYSCVTNPRGVVIILNNKNFHNNPQMTRHGSEYDVINLDNIFTQMGYQVITYWDLPRDRTLTYFNEASKNPQLRNVSCLIVCILSHGKGNKSFLAHDSETVTLDEIRRCFLDQGCVYLRRKPKVFFTHFCRGSDDELETPLVPDAQLEAFKDMLCIYSTTEGFRAYRHGSLGTPFVRALCETLAKHAGKEELCNGLTKIFQREYKKLKGSTTPEIQNFNFTKDFYFNPLPQR